MKEQEEVERIKQEALEEISKSEDLKGLDEIRVKHLGKKGGLTALLKSMKDMSAEERPKFGALVNKVKEEVEAKIQEREAALQKVALNMKLKAEEIDVTLPSQKIKRGSKHPLNRVIDEVEDLFVSMGYDVVTGPELETDEYCFERLNLPQGHPARDMQDSFYISPEYLLRTQTSAVQARTMMANEEKTPIRIIVPGKTFRREDD